MIDISNVAVIKRICQRYQRNGRKRPSESTSHYKNIGLLENVFVLIITDFLWKYVLISSVDSQEMHELKLNTLFLFIDSFHKTSILEHMKTFAIPPFEIVLARYTKIRIVN